MVKNNVLKILFEDSTLREKWWSFVVRNRVKTGNFSVGISMMTMGGMAGTRLAQCFPIGKQKYALPALGFTLGIAGGVAASYVSTETKDDITESFQSARMKTYKAQLHTSQINLAGAIKRIEDEQRTIESVGIDNKKPNWKMDRIRERIDQELVLSDEIRENLLTSFFDQIHLLNSRMLVIQNKIQLATEHENVEAQDRLQKELSTYKKAYAESKKQLEDTLGEEFKMYELLKGRKIPTDVATTISSKTTEIGSAKKWTSQFTDQIESTANWGKKNQSDSLMNEQENQRLLEKIYVWGFKTQPFLKTMEYNN